MGSLHKGLRAAILHLRHAPRQIDDISTLVPAGRLVGPVLPPVPYPATWANVGACLRLQGRSALPVRPSRRPAGVFWVGGCVRVFFRARPLPFAPVSGASAI